ncbi:MAG: hypothetical protein JWP89_6032 [Schlesneria sp.]|nr:hypothetical protein [Schlesneria sp.]
MNTAMMVTRVSLLLVVTGLFAGMWSADSPDLRSPAEKQMARRASTPRMLLQDAKSTTNVIRTVSLSDRLPSIPLPRGIEAGTYLVVDQSGSTQQLTIEASSAATSANFVAIDHYTVRQSDQRWHFIRLDAVSDRKVTQPMRAVDLR